MVLILPLMVAKLINLLSVSGKAVPDTVVLWLCGVAFLGVCLFRFPPAEKVYDT